MNNKVSLKNPKDQNFEIYQSKVSNMLEKAAKKLFKDKAFHEEFRSIFALSSFLKYLSNLASFITSIFFELLFVVCSVFSAYYLFRLNIEIEVSTASINEEEQTPSTQLVKSTEKQVVPLSTQLAGVAPKIGFKSNAQECQLESCKNSFVSSVHNKKYCSGECRKMAYQERRYFKNQEN